MMERPLKSGFLTKEGYHVKNWKLRWFVLQGVDLTYYSSESTKAPTNLEKKGVLHLADAHKVSIDVALENSIIICTPTRVWRIKAPSKEEQKDWIDCILEACPGINREDSDKHLSLSSVEKLK